MVLDKVRVSVWVMGTYRAADLLYRKFRNYSTGSCTLDAAITLHYWVDDSSGDFYKGTKDARNRHFSVVSRQKCVKGTIKI